MLRSGLAWEMLPADMGCGYGMSCWRRLRDGHDADVRASLHRILLKRLHTARQIDWRRTWLHSAPVAAKKGGSATEPNPTDRGKPGTKRHPVTDARGTPLSLRIGPTNQHGSRRLAPTLDAIPPILGRVDDP